MAALRLAALRFAGRLALDFFALDFRADALRPPPFLAAPRDFELVRPERVDFRADFFAFVAIWLNPSVV